jgi:hypothetical protein
MPLRLGFDVDGVLADFRSAFLSTAREKLDVTPAPVSDPELAQQEITSREMARVWREIARTQNWWVRVPPFEPDQIKRLSTLSRHRRWEVFFLTWRPETAGERVQLQTQFWLETHGFYLPSVMTVPGSRGGIAGAARLDIFVDDLLVNCVEVISASAAKVMLMMRTADAQPAVRARAEAQGIGVVRTLEEALDVIEHLDRRLQGQTGRLSKLTEWFRPVRSGATLPRNPRDINPLPPLDEKAPSD